MKYLRRVLLGIIIAVTANIFVPPAYLAAELHINISLTASLFIAVLGTVSLVCNIVCPKKSAAPAKALRALDNGCELLHLFLISVVLTFAVQLCRTIRSFDIMRPWLGFGSGGAFAVWLFSLIMAVIIEAAVFWGGMLRLYATSVQLGIKHRVLAALAAWVPGLNIWYLLKLIRVAEAEVELECEKLALDAARAESETCKTRYPILLVHGVLFRDFRYLNYWGRIPGALKKNGSDIFSGSSSPPPLWRSAERSLRSVFQALFPKQAAKRSTSSPTPRAGSTAARQFRSLTQHSTLQPHDHKYAPSGLHFCRISSLQAS